MIIKKKGSGEYCKKENKMKIFGLIKAMCIYTCMRMNKKMLKVKRHQIIKAKEMNI